MRRRCWPIVLTLALAAGWAGDVHACGCFTSPPCQSAATADAIFSGTVLAEELVDTLEAGVPSKAWRTRVQVEQPYLNVPGQVVELFQPFNSCTYHFRQGERYLVYARKDGFARLTTSNCARTRPIAEAAEDLQYLVTLGQTPPTRRVFGRVTESRRDPAEQAFVDYGPLGGLTVNLRGAAFSRNAVTDAHGRYEFTGVPAGGMTVSLPAPDGVDRRDLASEFELHHERGCQQRDFVVIPIAGASGTLLDAAGQPVAGVDVDAVAAELAGFTPPPYNRPARTDERGRFRFEDLPPGTYVFGLNLTRRDKPAGPPSPLTTSVDLAAGEHKDLGTIRLNLAPR